MDVPDRKIDVLDHGFVRLVSYTQPTYEVAIDQIGSHWDGDLEVVRNARTSYKGSARTGADKHKDAKLLERLFLAHHTSPFEAMHFTFEVQAPIFVFRQWHRHRTWAYSEDSARYTEMPALFYVPAVDRMHTQHATEKQMSSDELVDDSIALQAQYLMKEQGEQAFVKYQWLLASGISRELARTVLPVSVYSHMFATVNLANLIKFMMLRMDKHAQYEIRVYADAMCELIKPICPTTVEVFNTSFMVQTFVQEAIERARKKQTGLIDCYDVIRAMCEELGIK